MTKLPLPRGPISEDLLHHLGRKRHRIGPVCDPATAETLGDEDLQLSLYVCYELHYRGFRGVEEGWEWEPSLIDLRETLERPFESELRSVLEATPNPVLAETIDLVLREIADDGEEPSLSSYIERSANLDQVREFMIHRSAYQLKEADPHSWAIPRMSGPPKAALVEVQADEYGGGRAERIHAQLFAEAMQELGLDPSYGAYLDHIPGVTLATVNLMSMCGLHRRLLGAIVGHLAVSEMTSSLPNRRYADGLRRLGFNGRATEFFDEHVLADAVHENIAAVDLAGGLVRQQPNRAAELIWGARSLVLLEQRWSGHLLDCWNEGRGSLREDPAIVAA